MKHWSHSAACKGMDTEIFFSRKFLATDIAKKICFQCPVQLECLEDSLKAETFWYGNRHGVFGGMTPKERDKLQKKRMMNDD